MGANERKAKANSQTESYSLERCILLRPAQLGAVLYSFRPGPLSYIPRLDLGRPRPLFHEAPHRSPLPWG